MYISIIKATVIALLIVSVTSSEAAADPKALDFAPGMVQVIKIDGSREGRTFEGIGAVSAGASSRLLMDYPEPQRSEILDYLFKPNFGASLQHLKVEIGGDVNSTDGSEQSHARTRDELENPKPEYYDRGYEWWLMKEARKRNPDIALDALQWGAPGWIGNGKFYSQDNADFIAAFHKGARDYHGLKTNYQGTWNEMPHGPDYVPFVKMLRKALDKNGLQDVKLVIGEQVQVWEAVQNIHDDPELRKAVHAISVHYPGYITPDAAKNIGIPIWDSEDGPWRGDWVGVSMLAKTYNRVYESGRLTKTEIWSPISSYYDSLELAGSGLMKANTPWSGYYEVQPAIWATAHTTQFAKPGWKYIDSGCGRLNGDGSYVTLKSPDGSGNYSIIIETMGWLNMFRPPWTLRFKLKNLSDAPLHVWRTTQDSTWVGSTPALFAKEDTITPKNGTFDLALHANSIVTLTTTTGQQKGSYTITQNIGSFQFPYKDDFESYGLDKLPKYISDQNGAFSIAERADGTGKCLRQQSLQPSIDWAHHLDYPWTVVGDSAWTDYEVSADVRIDSAGTARIFGRMDAPNLTTAKPVPGGYCLSIEQDGAWQLAVRTKVLSSGKIQAAPNSWHNLKLKMKGTSITAMIDGQEVLSITDSTHTKGMAGLGSSFNYVEFDNLTVSP
ncbi:MAG: family 16 glycoside hydrolase [Armatimonadota bacterium]